MSLNQAQLLQFQESGFLLLEDALTDQDLDPIIDEYEAYIDWRAHQLLSEDKISQLYSHQSFEQRLVSICRENNEIYSELDIMYLRGKASFQFLKNPNKIMPLQHYRWRPCGDVLTEEEFNKNKKLLLDKLN